jgi:large subunit ribosomal protein L29
MKENADKARALDTAEIHKQLGESAEQMFRLRFQMSMGQADGLKKLRMMRKERARMLTVLRERELHPENAAAVPVKKAKKAKASKADAKPAAKAAAAAKPKAAAKAAAPKAAVKHAAPKASAPKIATKARKSSKG